MAASVSPLARRLVRLLDQNIETGRNVLESGLELRTYDKACGYQRCLREIRKMVLDEDRGDPEGDPDDQDPQPTVADLVADEDPE